MSGSATARVTFAILRTLRTDIFPRLDDLHDAEATHFLVAIGAAVWREQIRFVEANHANPVSAADLAGMPARRSARRWVPPHVTHATLLVSMSISSIYLHAALCMPDGIRDEKSRS
jgi:hypothetical protein